VVGFASVSFGAGTPAASVTYVSAQQLKAVAPSHAAGWVSIYATNTVGTSAPVTADIYAFGPPSVTNVNPSAGPTAGGHTVTIKGNGFVPGATVKFGPTAATSVQFVSGGQLTALAPARPSGTVNVTVTNPAGTSAIATADRYTYS
jgi:hypothetical protein